MNDDDQAEVWIQFGPKPHQQITPEVASMILTAWGEASPAQFGSYLAEAMTGVRPSSTRKTKP